MQRSQRARSGEAVNVEPLGLLERAHRGLRARAVDAVDLDGVPRDDKECLKLDDLWAVVVAAEHCRDGRCWARCGDGRRVAVPRDGAAAEPRAENVLKERRFAVEQARAAHRAHAVRVVREGLLVDAAHRLDAPAGPPLGAVDRHLPAAHHRGDDDVLAVPSEQRGVAPGVVGEDGARLGLAAGKRLGGEHRRPGGLRREPRHDRRGLGLDGVHDGRRRAEGIQGVERGLRHGGAHRHALAVDREVVPGNLDDDAAHLERVPPGRVEASFGDGAEDGGVAGSAVRGERAEEGQTWVLSVAGGGRVDMFRRMANYGFFYTSMAVADALRVVSEAAAARFGDRLMVRVGAANVLLVEAPRVCPATPAEARRMRLAYGEPAGFSVEVNPPWCEEPCLAFRHGPHPRWLRWVQGCIEEQVSDMLGIPIVYDATDEARGPGRRWYRSAGTYRGHAMQLVGYLDEVDRRMFGFHITPPEFLDAA